MFDGVPDQFHQFITPRTSLPLHLPFPLQASTTTTTPNTFPTTFDPYNNHPSHHHQLPLQPNLLHPSLHHHKGEEKEENSSTISVTFEIEREDQRHHLPEPINDPWTNDEVLALLRIRSSMESWFPEFTWEHVSRKLAEVGYKRSAEKCKEKFEEESRYFNYGKNNNNYRFLSELEELYQGDDHNQNPHQVGNETTRSEGQQDKNNMDHALEEDTRNDDVSVTKKKNDEVVVVEKSTNKERKRKRGDDRFEVFKGFCESVVQKMMAQQEEMHNKLIEDMLRRDEDKFTREEAWKKQEMEKMNKELEMMAREQAIAGDRQANVIEFLNKFSATSLSKPSVTLTPTHCSNSNPLHSQNPNPINPNPNPSAPEIDNNLQPTPSSAMILNHLNKSAENPSSILSSSTSAPVPKNNPSSSLNSQNDPVETNSVVSKDDIGRRWPKDEVLALINLRCTSLNNNNSEEKEGNNKAPLWERISQGMLELGYKRSAKRCKEKWENINKYFRKTKDANRKRSLDSRTCPYFHLLSNLYNQGKLVLQSERQEGHLNAPENPEQAPPDQKTQAESSQVGPAGNFTMQQQQQQVHHGGEKTSMQVPSLDFDQF